MKKFVFVLSALVLSASSSLCAAQNSSKASAQSGQMTNQNADCSQLSPQEQNFANQVMDMNNKTMFCSQMTMQQRQQAMQMMGQPDASGNMMNADQAVQQVMGATPMTQPKPKASNGGCPVK